MKKHNKGSITPALLVITTAFIIAIYGLLFVLTLQFDFSQRQVASEKAIHIAEAGINYYRWHLDEDPDDFTDGTGGTGPYIHDYKDPQGDVIGQYSLEITAPTESSPIVTISSTGWTDHYPSVKRKITAKYGRVSLTRYAFLHNSSMWFGPDITVYGPVFSNGGIRQDGTNTSTVQSAKETYICGLETGCNTPEEKPGIWGDGELKSLWEYPATPIDFENIKLDFIEMKSSAQADGLYLGPSGAQGYHLVFSADGNVTVYKVTGANNIQGYSWEEGCENLYQEIVSEVAVGTYSVSSTPIIFVEDHVWPEGVVNGKTTIAAARFPLGTFNANIWLNNNLTYLAKDGNHKLGLIAEKDVVIGLNTPETFELNAAVLAQNGRIIRHNYGAQGCYKALGKDRMRDKFIFYGSLISNFRSYWNYSSGPHLEASGFEESTLDYDPTNYGDPPPYFPSSGGYQFISWSEEEI
jgi:hypothetical protein